VVRGNYQDYAVNDAAFTISRDGRLARDAMLGLMKACRKLGLSFYHYLGDRLGISGKVIPSLSGLVAAKS
jgi:hypothetical protein